MNLNGVSAPGQVALLSIEGLDLESAIMAVQTNRVNLIDQQLKDQMSVVQERNQRINDLNANMSAMNKVLGALPTGATPANDTRVGFAADFAAASPQVVNETKVAAAESSVAVNKLGTVADAIKSVTDNALLKNTAFQTLFKPAFDALLKNQQDTLAALKTMDATMFGGNGALNPVIAAYEAKNKATIATLTAAGFYSEPTSNFSGIDTRSKAEAAIKALQGQIDALGNTQQMDMLRLQSLSNKRNEAFDIMSNFMKKMADNRSSIIQKM